MKARHAVLLIATASLPAQAALVIAGSSPATNDRFANHPSFVAASQNWSGVGRSNSGAWATLLSPNVFVSATHFHPGIGSTVTFYPGNDPAATSLSRTVAGGQQIAGTDLWIGHFSSALPASIQSYPRVTIPISSGNFASSGVAGANALLSGVSTSPSYGSSQTLAHAVGTNRIEAFIPGVSDGSSSGDTLITVRNFSGDTAFGYSTTTYESQLTVGDSGSPLMLISNGQLYLAGIAWAIAQADIDPGPLVATRDLSIYTYTGNLETNISSYIGLNSVPEPSLLALAAISLPIIQRRRRKHEPEPMRRHR
ncbi:MAG: hypothetical protein EAZ84_13240 [Verrucomicrobia bacterium]|nr:MAG: hypothetical protein EAZ84_13240 [Verrucomicrobiota bacterium]TAE86710.1 MAG: hypothetical protein EAZ82_09975 [Verrucomicrobiota bacterium]TAF24534.1 MAG: hypothetical protein EAZ71_10505 [Verrucomicrobiota bacterium]